jgi:hypothetical protein
VEASVEASGTPVTALGGIDVGPLGIGPTPLAMLIVLLALGAIGVIVIVALSQAGGPVVDKRWPANEPLSPSEVLWAEAGGHVSKTFPGLDPDMARDLTVYMTSKKLKPGDVLIEAGDLPTSFVMLKSGAAERVDEAGVATAVKPGESFGADNIIRRQPHRITVRATAPSEIMVLEAEDYLAGVALGMREQDDDDYVVRVLGEYLAADAGSASGPVSAAAASAPMIAPPPAPPAPSPALAPPITSSGAGDRPAWLASTHYITHETDGYVLPAGDISTRTLVPGTPVQLFEVLPGWARVRTADGWMGWVVESAVAEG